MHAKFLTNNISENIELIKAAFPVNYSFVIRNIILKGNIKCALLYMSNISNKETIEARIIDPLLFQFDNEINLDGCVVDFIAQRYISISDTSISNDINMILSRIQSGDTVVFINNENKAIICSTSKSNLKNVSEIKIEETLRGEKSAFVDVLNSNIGLIQEKLKNKQLKVDKYTLGENNNAETALVYIENLIDENILKQLKKKLSDIKCPYIPDTGYLAKYIDESKFSIFPQSKTSEKPDKVISDLLQGKAAIFVNGCAYAVILPVVFIEFFQAFEDYSNRIILANFDRFLRLLSVIVVVSLAPIYLVLLKYNVELLPLNFIKVIIVSRKDIPLPPFMEIMLMEIIIEFLREGGLRLPSIVGQTLSIVGGIILGQAAIQASVVSPATLIVVTVGAIATFVIPNYEMSISIRLIRFFLLVIAEMLGFYGVIIGLFFIIAHLVNLESLGVPYFAPFTPMYVKDLRDSIVRMPINEIQSTTETFTNSANSSNGDKSSKSDEGSKSDEQK
ncbi:spore germination protein [Clostridium sp. 'deep sea']|uniref:spore germination protein n=1 Tax=Clostridium sp. 'deep sea' TaxID=2779445 RepID=UPI0018964F4B|nr:spore germination protein [Clostridium sp. 'deep sea']QOR35974.1 spore germination protein [Clostridium sp. 'deep sea']